MRGRLKPRTAVVRRINMDIRLQHETNEPQPATSEFHSPPDVAPTTDLLESVPPATVPDLVREVTEGVAWQKRFIKRAVAFPAVMLSAIAIVIACVQLLVGNEGVDRLVAQPLFIALVTCVFLGTPIVSAVALSTHATRLTKHSRALADKDDVDLVGPLIDLLGIENRKVRTNAMRALTRLLPRMTTDDAEALTVDQRERLIKLLRMNPDFYLYKDVGAIFRPPKLDRETNVAAIDFRAAILRSYARIGGTMEISTVRLLAGTLSMNPAQQLLSLAALECLPSVQSRAEFEARHGALLRPTTPDGTSTTLLMPTEPTSVHTADDLLHPIV